MDIHEVKYMCNLLMAPLVFLQAETKWRTNTNDRLILPASCAACINYARDRKKVGVSMLEPFTALPSVHIDKYISFIMGAARRVTHAVREMCTTCLLGDIDCGYFYKWVIRWITHDACYTKNPELLAPFLEMSTLSHKRSSCDRSLFLIENIICCSNNTITNRI